MKSFNGHRSWNAWNASLWLSNNEVLDKMVNNYINIKEYSINKVFNILKDDLVNSKTPDGATITARALRTYIEEFNQ